MNDRYCKHLYSAVASYGASPCFVGNRELSNRSGFSSLYAVTETDAEAITKAGTCAGYKGTVWSERLWLDFDDYEAADRAELKLREMGYDFIGYDSGGRGAHFGILRDISPSHLLPAQDKRWAKEHFPDADGSIYTHLHPFRLPGTKHERTGRRKELVVEVKGNALTLPKWEKSNGVLFTGNNNRNSSNDGHFYLDRLLSNSKPFLNGQRHDALVRLAYALKQDVGATSEFSLGWIRAVNEKFEEPKTEEEIEYIIRSIFE